MTPTIPTAFEERMKHVLQDDWTLLKESLQHAASPVSIRRNLLKYQDIGDTPVPWCKTGSYLLSRPVFTLDPVFHAGAYYVQEASSMFLEQAITQAADLQKPLRVLDLCAAPGGKSTHLESLLNNESLLVSNEVIRSRAGVLAENLQKWGSPNVVVTNNDPEDFARMPGFYDIIVVDAPCSGEGLFRKDPHAMNEWSENNVELCSKRQRRIISDIWSAIKEDGLLIYSTCTYSRQENEDNLVWLSQNHSIEFIPLTIDPAWGVELVNQDGIIGYRCYPHKVTGEGFFLSVMRKKERADTYKPPHKSKNTPAFQTPGAKILSQLQTWVNSPESKTFIQREDVVQFFPSVIAEEIGWLSKNLRIVTAGTFMATLKHEKLVPEHAFALSTERQDMFHHLSLTREEALQYLRKEALQLSTEHTGFTLMQYKNIALGWANVLPNRINNLYPAEWRIRMSS